MKEMKPFDAHPEAVLPPGMTRRQLLTLCAAGTLPGLLAACSSPPVSHPTPLPSRSPSSISPTRRPSPTQPPPLTESDWSAFASSLQGALIRPTSPRYATARQLFNRRFDSVYPAAIAYAASLADVVTCIAFAQRFGLPLAPRSGGHSYAGYSTTTGLVVDVSRMNAVSVDTGTGSAIVGAGARMIDVYAALAQDGLALTAGTCPSFHHRTLAHSRVTLNDSSWMVRCQ